VSYLPDKLETEKVRKDLGYVIDDGCYAEQGRRTAVILKVPEEEGEDQPDAESHEPRDEEKRGALEVFELLQHRYPFRYFFHRLGKHFSLKFGHYSQDCVADYVVEGYDTQNGSIGKLIGERTLSAR